MIASTATCLASGSSASGGSHTASSANTPRPGAYGGGRAAAPLHAGQVGAPRGVRIARMARLGHDREQGRELLADVAGLAPAEARVARWIQRLAQLHFQQPPEAVLEQRHPPVGMDYGVHGIEEGRQPGAGAGEVGNASEASGRRSVGCSDASGPSRRHRASAATRPRAGPRSAAAVSDPSSGASGIPAAASRPRQRTIARSCRAGRRRSRRRGVVLLVRLGHLRGDHRRGDVDVGACAGSGPWSAGVARARSPSSPLGGREPLRGLPGLRAGSPARARGCVRGSAGGWRTARSGRCRRRTACG